MEIEKEKEKTLKTKKQRKERNPVLPTQGSWRETERVGVEVDLLQREGPQRAEQTGGGGEADLPGGAAHRMPQ